MSFVRALARWLLLTLLIYVAGHVAQAYGAVISEATLESRGTIVELHFSVRGRQPVWRLDRERQQLAITLEHTRLGISPEPLAGREQLPVTAVRASEMGDGARSGEAVYVPTKIKNAIWVASARPPVIQWRRAMIQPSHTRMATASVMPVARK